MIKGGRTSAATNIQAAKQILFSLIDLLETEFAKLGDSTTMPRSQYEQLSGYVNRQTEELGRLMGPVREQGIQLDESYTSMLEHARDLIVELETGYTITGGKRRRKTRRRSKTLRRK
jgi:hypothetical protein